jgi:hypothetical protein
MLTTYLIGLLTCTWLYIAAHDNKGDMLINDSRERGNYQFFHIAVSLVYR